MPHEADPVSLNPVDSWDPVFALTDQHRADLAVVASLTSSDERWDAANDAELQSWVALTRSQPATLAGLHAYAQHIAGYRDLRHLGGDEGLADALTNIAAAMRSLAELNGGPVITGCSSANSIGDPRLEAAVASIRTVLSERYPGAIITAQIELGKGTGGVAVGALGVPGFEARLIFSRCMRASAPASQPIHRRTGSGHTEGSARNTGEDRSC